MAIIKTKAYIMEEHKVNIIQISQSISPTKYNELIEFARSCSWNGTGKYFADLLAYNEFDNTEKIFAAIHNNQIIGFAGLVKESCIEDVEYTPWLDFLFVDEAYRNKGVAGMLIKHILHIAKNDNIDNIYLCTASHKEMYMKFGFRTFFRTKINNNTDDCAVMKLSINDIV